MRSISDKPKTGKEDFSGDIESIMRNFDFDRVHKVMRFLNWQWAQNSGPTRVPDLEEIKEKAGKQLLEVSGKPADNWVKSGGFVAAKLKYEHGVQLELYFELCSWEGKDW